MAPPLKMTRIGTESFRVWVYKQYEDEITTYLIREQRTRDNMVNVLIGEALAARRLDEKERLDKRNNAPRSTCKRPKSKLKRLRK